MSFTKYPLDPAIQAELDKLNAAVLAAVKARTEWMDAHMEAVSKAKVGDEVYDLESGQRVGVISRLYRYHGDGKDWRYDTEMSVEAEYCTHHNCYDNTSRQPFAIGTKQEARDRAEWRVKALSDQP